MYQVASGNCQADSLYAYNEGKQHAQLALIFLLLAIIAGLLGFTGIKGTASWIAQILFMVFIVLLIINLIFGGTRALAEIGGTGLQSLLLLR